MTKYKLSILFPTFNRQHEVEHNLKILRETITVPYEVIIMDNSPRSVKFDTRNGERVIATGKNLGTAARNIGIAEAVGEFILLLDDDSHPLKGAVETAIAELENAPPETGGITSRVERLNGELENPPLLPTVFHGCGVLFRAEVLKKFQDGLYPEDFCFYGEEYWSTLKLYKAGYRLQHLDSFRICHRMSIHGRDKAKILFHLTLNNRRTWTPFVPEAYIDKIEYDTTRRYQLICAKEGVPQAFKEAMNKKITIQSHNNISMKDVDFEAYSMLDRFAALIDSDNFDRTIPVLLCGCGKFPTLWGDFLRVAGVPEVKIGDFNNGIAGKAYGRYKILQPIDIVKFARTGFQLLCGHSARADNIRWHNFLAENNITKVLELTVV